MTDSCIETQQDEAGVQIIVRGQAPLSEAAVLLDHARAAITAGRDIRLNLGDAGHLHTGVLQVLVAFERAARKHALRFELGAQSEAARRTLTLAGLNSWPNEAVL